MAMCVGQLLYTTLLLFKLCKLRDLNNTVVWSRARGSQNLFMHTRAMYTIC